MADRIFAYGLLIGLIVMIIALAAAVYVDGGFR